LAPLTILVVDNTMDRLCSICKDWAAVNRRDQEKNEESWALGKYADIQKRVYCPMCRLVAASKDYGLDEEDVEIEWLAGAKGFSTNISREGTYLRYFSRKDRKNDTAAGKLVHSTQIDVSNLELFYRHLKIDHIAPSASLSSS
jgi:hypothetical protein